MTLTLKSHASRGVFTTVSIFLATLLAAFLATLLTGQPALAQSEVADDASLEEVYVVGSRRRDRSASDSPVPVDVISAEEFAAQGDSNLDTLISSVVPSYVVGQEPISDAATFIRPATLRGLPSDSTLVLVNGKRRHRAAVIALLGPVAGGAQGPDVSVIPAIALERLEVLRDGAAAQYGSDAIAGIMNFVLKEDTSGVTVDAKWGEFYEGDGTALTLSANAGLPLTDSGFANLSFEWKESDPTDRAVQQNNGSSLIAGGNESIRNPVQVWGAPEYADDFKIFGNFGIDLNSDTELYAFTNYAEREVEGGFYFRNPTTPGSQRSGVFAGPWLDSSGGILPDDMLDKKGNPLPTVTDPTRSLRIADLSGSWAEGRAENCSHVPITLKDGNPDHAKIDKAVKDLPADCYTPFERFPGGFTPQFGGRIEDSSFALGVRGQFGNWYYDVSAVTGESDAEFYIYNTINPQLLAMRDNIPTSYEAGGYTETDTVFNIDVSSPIDIGDITVNVAAGLEWREEVFEITAGERNSWFDWDETNNLADQGFGIGSNGFVGFQERIANKHESESVGAYIDVESDVTSDLLLGGALRYEDYDEFGDTLNFKLAARYQVTDTIALRAAYSTGFRAPTAGQANLGNITTRFSDGMLADVGTLPPTDLIGLQLQYCSESGVTVAACTGQGQTVLTESPEALEPEESTNITLGAVFQLGPVDVTVDYYDIEIEEKIAFTQEFTLTDTNRQQLADTGNFTTEQAADLTEIRFFTNQQTLESSGIDVVATWPFDLGNGTSTLTAVANWSEIDLSKFNANFTNTRRIRQIEEGRPDFRFNVTWTHLQDQWRFMIRSRYYGEYYDAPTESESAAFDHANPENLVDVEIGYDFTDQLSLVLGAQNIFDTYPDQNTKGEIAGLIYPESSPFGFNGGFYYLRARWSFDY